MNVQIFGECIFVFFFVYLLNFFSFSFDFACVLEFCVGYGLMLQSVPAFPVVGFVLIWVGVSPLVNLSLLLPLCSIIVTWLLKDN